MNTKIAAKLNVGDRVEHLTLGKGTLIKTTCYPSQVLVQFDNNIETFGTDILAVDVDCLKLGD